MTRREALHRATALSGLTLSPALFAVLEGCQASTEPTWTPQTLSQGQWAVVRQLVNRILPATDTPGALDLQVDRFVDLALGQLFTDEQRQHLLGQMDDYSLQDAAFAEDEPAIADQKLLLLEQTYAAERDVKPDAPPPFFRTIKQLALLGYFTSEPVMKNQMNYHAVPGRYVGCTNLSEDPRLYVDNNV
ncbi:MAG: gluconate 2-dehydrogenase subunit 3 family protein [Tunicatimonas sp.]